jgi:hypothetical protein
MDPEEARLEEEVRRRRADLVARGDSLRRSVIDTFDPREAIKRHPVGGLLASLGVGIVAGRVLTGRRSRASNGKAESESSEGSPLASLAMGFLPGLLVKIVPLVAAPLLSFFQREPSVAKEDAGGDGAPGEGSGR